MVSGQGTRRRVCGSVLSRPDYWQRREALVAVLRFLAALDTSHWRENAVAARLVAGAVENDHV